MATEASSLSPVHATLGAEDPSGELEAWIDEKTIRSENVEEIVVNLVSLTLPAELWNPGRAINPLQENVEAWSWFWNRAAGNFVDRGENEAATEIWSAHYLALLSLQLRLRQRYHKGMPLCNIGFAFARARQRRWAARSWLLGVIEDTLTDISTVSDALNYQNLLKMQVAPAVLDQLTTTVESRFLDQSVIPQFPETVIESWLRPTTIVLSEPCVRHTDSLSESLIRSYPRLPDSARPWTTLSMYWQFADWVGGLINGG